jgi:hypothetical protein
VIDQIEDVLLPVFRGVVQADRMRLDGDAALALEVHRVEHLRRHLARLQGAGELEESGPRASTCHGRCAR